MPTERTINSWMEFYHPNTSDPATVAVLNNNLRSRLEYAVRNEDGDFTTEAVELAQSILDRRGWA